MENPYSMRLWNKKSEKYPRPVKMNQKRLKGKKDQNKRNKKNSGN